MSRPKRYASTVRILKSSRVHESFIKYNVRKTVNLFELDILLIKIQSQLESRGILRKMAYTERLHPKGVPFSGVKYMLRLGFHLLKYMKG